MNKLRFPATRRVFMSIHHSVWLTADVTPIKFLLVCSADAGEGVTTVAARLPLAAAELQTRPVLLMEGNFCQPGVLVAWPKLSANGCDKGDLVLNHRTLPIPEWIYNKL